MLNKSVGPGMAWIGMTFARQEAEARKKLEAQMETMLQAGVCVCLEGECDVLMLQL